VPVLCVPNFSEGSNTRVLAALGEQIRSVPETLLLGYEREQDHNRAVYTFAGPAEAVLESAVRAAVQAAQEIDLTAHRGVHPRIGAADVIPFVPLDETTMEECVSIAERAAEAIWTRAGVPSYLYEFAARVPARRKLEFIRKHGFEALRVSSDPSLLPDVGGPELHPTAGACAIGARRILIAANVNLDSSDLALAKRIARSIRASSGGLPHVKALGLLLASKNTAQVSINLTSFEVTGLAVAYERVARLAKSAGAGIASTEIIGFPPRAALQNAGEFLAVCANWNSGRILENAIAAGTASRSK
jgi:glutamate formiminotransferase